MRAFVVLGLVFSVSSQEIGLGKRLRNDLFYVEWDVKPELNQSTWLQVAVFMCSTTRKRIVWEDWLGEHTQHSRSIHTQPWRRHGHKLFHRYQHTLLLFLIYKWLFKSITIILRVLKKLQRPSTLSWRMCRAGPTARKSLDPASCLVCMTRPGSCSFCSRIRSAGGIISYLVWLGWSGDWPD